MIQSVKKFHEETSTIRPESRAITLKSVCDDVFKPLSMPVAGLDPIQNTSKMKESKDYSSGMINMQKQATNEALDSIDALLKDMKTLLVEDNPTDQIIIQNTAQKLKLDITIVNDAAEAIRHLKAEDNENPFQLMIIDFKMPELDGLTASRYITEELQLRNPPKIILLSAFERDEIFKQPNYLNSVNAFITKPINVRSLKDAIFNIVKITITSQEVWPVKPAPTTNKKTLSHERIDNLLSKCHILLVEDNLINQRVAAGILKLKGTRVTIANNGQEAVNIVNNAHANEFDVILMDIDMPILDGYEATFIIKQNPATQTLPIIALTAHNSEEDKEKCFKVGMSDFLTKPIKSEPLYHSIATSIINAEK